MVNLALVRNVQTNIRRYKAHHEGGNHMLRPGSQYECARGIIDNFEEVNPATGLVSTNDYGVAPGGLGKTVQLIDFIIGINTLNRRNVLGDPIRGKRVFIGVPTNALALQWYDAFFGEVNEETGVREPSVFGDHFSEDNVGLYHPGLTPAQKRHVLSKPIVIVVHDSAMLLHDHIDPVTGQPDPLLRPEEFDVCLLDEVDYRVRGDVLGGFYKEAFFPHCMILGVTATHIYRNGKTIGDYLFDGKKPMFEITHWEAVQRKEIAPHINIIFEPEIDPSSIIIPDASNRDWDDYTEAQQMSIIKQTSSDEAILEILKVGHHPYTQQPLREIMQLHEAVNIEHAKHIAEMCNAEFGNKFAQAVWGGEDADMDDEIRKLTRWFLRTGEIMAGAMCLIWGRGVNIRELGATFQHAPTLSPGKAMQFHTRASRLFGDKIALYISPFINGIDQVVIGQLMNGMIILPDGSEFAPTTGKRADPAEAKPWPKISGVKMHYTLRHMEMFVQERKRERYVNGLAIKSKTMWTVDEMARALSVGSPIMRERVYAPLQEAYEKRAARAKFVDVESGERGEFLYVHGKPFPVWRIGLRQHQRREVFCVDQGLQPLCEHTLYGRLDPVPPEMLRQNTARTILECTASQIDELWKTLQNEFFHRKPYERTAVIRGIGFSYEDFGFYKITAKDIRRPEFFISPDALIPAYCLIHDVDQELARDWAEKSSVRMCKTSAWLTEAEALESLGLNRLVAREECDFVESVFQNLGSKSRSLKLGEEHVVTLSLAGETRHLKCSKRWLPLASLENQHALCIDDNALERIRQALGLESKFDNDTRAYRRRPRPGSHDEQPRPSA